MGRYITRRLLLTIPVLIGSSFLIFAMVYALPGDPIRALAGDRPLAPGVVAQLRDEFNLDDNLFVQYFKYIGGFFQGDFGTDFSGRPVLDTIERALPVTVRLTIVAVVIETIMGIAAGVLAALKRGSFFDNLVLISTTLLVSVPVFVLASSPSSPSVSSWGSSRSPASTTAGRVTCFPDWCSHRCRWRTWLV